MQRKRRSATRFFYASCAAVQAAANKSPVCLPYQRSPFTLYAVLSCRPLNHNPRRPNLLSDPRSTAILCRAVASDGHRRGLMSEVTVLLRKVANNDRAAMDSLFELLYSDLHRMARATGGKRSVDAARYDFAGARSLFAIAQRGPHRPRQPRALHGLCVAGAARDHRRFRAQAKCRTPWRRPT